MNEIDPSLRITADAVRNHPGQSGGRAAHKLNPMAVQIAAQFRQDTMSPVMVIGLLRLGEFLLLALSGLAIFVHYVGFPGPLWAGYLIATLSASAATVLFLDIADSYQLPVLRHPARQSGRILAIWSGVFGLLALIGFLAKTSADYSRVWFISWYVLGYAFLMIERFFVARAIRKWARNGRMERRAVIVGGGRDAERLIRSLEQQPDNDIRICGIFDDRDDTRSPRIIAGYPKLGTLDELIEFARLARIDMLIVSLPLTAESRVLTMLKKLWVLPVDIRLSAHSNQLRFRPRAYSFVGQVPMLDIFDKPIANWDSVAKRVFDIVFSLLAIVALAPVMLGTAIAIKLDSRGPVLFRQKRHGFNNEEIDVLKFRSMYTDQCDPTAKNAVTKNDPRVTRVGRFIRKASIDELPQFFNSLTGSLSLVGPRPHAVAARTHDRIYDEIVDGYFARHRVKPGVTGWAQINGWRGEIDSDEKIQKRTEYDLFYIENWSLWFDLKILFLTPIRLIKSDNAY
jgi:Undecaprenyl-phosphate glucose phosphotransferase